MQQSCLCALLLGDTDGATSTTGGLGVLTTDTDTPVVTETTVSTDLLQAFQVLTELVVQTVGQGVGVFTILVVLLSVQEPVGDLVLGGVLHDGDDAFQLIVSQFTGTGFDDSVKVHPPKDLTLRVCPCPD
jgi:hypothetical protein